VRDLLTACLVSSSNDAAVALAEAVSGSEREFAKRMNLKARELGMNNTFFVNATGLTDKNHKQYSTAYDLTKLMRAAIQDKQIDETMGITQTVIHGSDGKAIALRTHNKMLWRMPKFVKGKTGWTYASRHTFVGTNYSPNKSIAFAMLSSKKPWTDIERLATFGLVLERRR
jgi:D-alanyl-D-alanine carboxypeptidase